MRNRIKCAKEKFKLTHLTFAAAVQMSSPMRCHQPQRKRMRRRGLASFPHLVMMSLWSVLPTISLESHVTSLIPVSVKKRCCGKKHGLFNVELNNLHTAYF